MSYGNVFIIAAPSGAGKTTLVKALVRETPNLQVSISYTTRPPRPGEEEACNYFFVSTEQFLLMVEQDQFVEYATVFNHLYGTARSTLEHIRLQGIDIVLEIDWQGMQQIKALIPDSISIFILPPSMEHLQARLLQRQQDNQQIISNRLADARATISHIYDFDFVVLNDDFAHAVRDLKTIIYASRLRRQAQLHTHQQLLASWLGD